MQPGLGQQEHCREGQVATDPFMSEPRGSLRVAQQTCLQDTFFTSSLSIAVFPISANSFHCLDRLDFLGRLAIFQQGENIDQDFRIVYFWAVTRPWVSR